ncbi:hypothetical protein ACFSCX_16365 [Bacillus salitolerans]|uniref:Lipoprotein n=1 Tax=Bacillus salitolerans TaxID=1437434 RepID=A0ABW4LSI4_9BACI
MNKTKKMMASISTVALVAGITGCSSNQVSVEQQVNRNINTQSSGTNNPTFVGPTDPYCDSWEEEGEGIFECEDYDSDYYGYYYHNGTYYRDKLAITKKKSSNSHSKPSTSSPASSTQANKSNASSNKVNQNQSTSSNITNKNSSTSTVNSSSSNGSSSSGFGSGTSSYGG